MFVSITELYNCCWASCLSLAVRTVKRTELVIDAFIPCPDILGVDISFIGVVSFVTSLLTYDACTLHSFVLGFDNCLFQSCVSHCFCAWRSWYSCPCSSLSIYCLFIYVFFAFRVSTSSGDIFALQSEHLLRVFCHYLVWWGGCSFCSEYLEVFEGSGLWMDYTSCRTIIFRVSTWKQFSRCVWSVAGASRKGERHSHSLERSWAIFDFFCSNYVLLHWEGQSFN